MVRLLSLPLLLFAANALSGQDPTAPLGWMVVEKSVTQPSKKKSAVQHRLPELQSIVCTTDKPCYAILNNKILSQGESIRGYRIKTIDPEYVSLQRNNKQWKLELFSLDIKNN